MKEPSIRLSCQVRQGKQSSEGALAYFTTIRRCQSTTGGERKVLGLKWETAPQDILGRGRQSKWRPLFGRMRLRWGRGALVSFLADSRLSAALY